MTIAQTTTAPTTIRTLPIVTIANTTTAPTTIQPRLVSTTTNTLAASALTIFTPGFRLTVSGGTTRVGATSGSRAPVGTSGRITMAIGETRSNMAGCGIRTTSGATSRIIM